MKSKMALLVLLALFQFTQAQKLVSRNGHIWFYSHTPLEDIEAHNRQVVSILDPATGELVYSLLVKSFEFRIALMQEHFNENYMESDKYPKSAFKGIITNINEINFSKDGIYQAKVNGDLTIHNITKSINATGTLEVNGREVTVRAKFVVSPRDFEIEIPALVEEKIAREIQVHVEVTYAAN
jgi:hypothetical protein